MSKTRQVLGKVLITFEGEFNSSTEYEQLDVVTYQGSTYIAKQDTKGNLPTNISYFALLVQKPIKGTDYFTEQEIEDIVSEITDDANSVFNQNVTEKTTAFNNNASSKTSDFNSNATTKTNEFNTNATSKTTTFDNHVTDKTTEFDTHVTSKTSDFDSHVTTKTTEFDSYVSDKITDFDSNAASKTTDFNDNATLKTTEFNNNADYLSNTLNKYKTIHNAMPKAEDEGSDITLNETADGVFMDILPEGNSSQETTEGKNFLDTRKNEFISNGVTFTPNKDGSIKITGTSTSAINVTIINSSNPPVLEPGTYTRSIKVVGTITKNDKSVLLTGRNDNNTNIMGDISISSNGAFSKTTTIAEQQTMSNINIYCNGEGVVFDCIIYVQLELGETATNYEVYTGGHASPNPDYPSDIKVVTGENKIIDSGRNMLSLSSLTTQTINGINLLKNDDGSITLNGTSTKSFSIDFPIEIPLFKNKKYVFSKKRTFGGASYSLSLRNANTNVISGTSMDSGESWKQIILSIDTIAKYFRLFINNNISFTNHTIYPMLEIGDTPSSFIKYQGLNVYSISLGSLKLVGIENYKDFIFKNEVGNPYYNENLTLNSWYKKKYFNELIFDGRTAGKRLLNPHSTITAENKGFFLKTITDKSTKLSSGNVYSLLCNYLKELSGGAVTAFNNNDSGVWWEGPTQNIYVVLPFTTQVEANEWLAELYDAGRPLTMLYLLNEPVDELITNTVLIEQLENLNNNARSYGETTIISCESDDENNVALVTKSVTLKDLNTVLDNINNAILEIGGGE